MVGPFHVFILENDLCLILKKIKKTIKKKLALMN